MGFYWVMLEWRAETMKYFCMKIDLCHGTADLLKFEHANTCIKHTIGKNKPCLVSTPIFRVRHVQSTYHELPSFWKLYFYKVLYGERARLAHSTICHMITIFKLMALWLWQLLVHLLILVCSFHSCVLFLCLAKLYRSCPICDKVYRSYNLVPEVFFRHEETREERQRSGERKPLVVGDTNLTIMLR